MGHFVQQHSPRVNEKYRLARNSDSTAYLKKHGIFELIAKFLTRILSERPESPAEHFVSSYHKMEMENLKVQLKMANERIERVERQNRRLNEKVKELEANRMRPNKKN